MASPHSLPPFRSHKRKREVDPVMKPSTRPSRPISSQLVCSPNRMRTRSLTSIRACIAQCNRLTSRTNKRTATTTLLPVNNKRMKTSQQVTSHDEYDRFRRFLYQSLNEIDDVMRKLIESKLMENTSLFADHIYQLVSELMLNNCDSIVPLVKYLHPYENSMKLLLAGINSKSTVFQECFLKKLKQTFDYEIKQQTISTSRIKLLK
jgi:hypothetical protein